MHLVSKENPIIFFSWSIHYLKPSELLVGHVVAAVLEFPPPPSTAVPI